MSKSKSKAKHRYVEKWVAVIISVPGVVPPRLVVEKITVPKGKACGLFDTPKAALVALRAAAQRDLDLSQARLDRDQRNLKLVEDCLAKLSEVLEVET